jgi:hypothetical protein
MLQAYKQEIGRLKEELCKSLAYSPSLTYLDLLAFNPFFPYLSQSRLIRHVVAYLDVKSVGSLVI